MTDSDYQAPPRKWPGTTLSDYRLLTPLVVMDALQRAGTTVCEPVLENHLEFPADVLGPIMATLIDARQCPVRRIISGRVCTLDGEIRAARLHDLQSRLRISPGAKACSSRRSAATDRSPASRLRVRAPTRIRSIGPTTSDASRASRSWNPTGLERSRADPLADARGRLKSWISVRRRVSRPPDPGPPHTFVCQREAVEPAVEFRRLGRADL